MKSTLYDKLFHTSMTRSEKRPYNEQWASISLTGALW